MDKQDQALCLLFAFRYALGRDTTAPCDMSGIIKNNYNILENWAIDQIIRDIEQHTSVVTGCNAYIWIDLAEFLKKNKKQIESY